MKSKQEVARIDKKEQRGTFGEGISAESGGGPSYEEICQRAYEIFLERGGEHGEDVRDWLQAEQELIAKYRG